MLPPYGPPPRLSVPSGVMSRRHLIQMTDTERDAFLAAPHNASLTTIGPDGYPHTTAMWYGLLDGIIHFATYAKSQKILNARRNPKISVLAEDGRSYAELRGVMIQADAEIIADADLATEVMFDMTARYEGVDVRSIGAGAMDAVRQRASKRAVLRVVPVRIMSWDHGKLAGVY